MKNFHIVLVLCVLSALGVGYWIADGGSESSLNSKPKMLAQADLDEKNAANVVKKSVEPSNNTDSGSGKLSKLKAVIDRQREKASTLPLALSDEKREKSIKRLWENKKVGYLNLMNSWSLQPAEIQAIEEIILQRDIALAKIDNKMDQTDFLSRESKTLKDEALKISKETDSKIAAIVGVEQLGELKRWEDSKIERRTLEKTIASLAQISPLSSEQEQVVLNVLHTERKNASASSGGVTSLYIQGENYRQSVVIKLTNVLKADQLAALESILKKENSRWEKN